MKLAAIILSYKRPTNIPLVISSLLEDGMKPRDIYVFNNNPDISLEIKEANVINSEKNLGCRVRHALALALDYTHFLFIDDDLAIKPGTIDGFKKYSEIFPEAVLGYFGSILGKGEKPYTNRKKYDYWRDIQAEVDVVIGRLHFCSRETIANSFLKSYRTGEDDIILSLSNKPYSNYVIPGEEVIDLPERGVGQYHRKDHWERRDRACLEVMGK